jgi:hypothetical protein
MANAENGGVRSVDRKDDTVFANSEFPIVCNRRRSLTRRPRLKGRGGKGLPPYGAVMTGGRHPLA